MTAQFSCPPKSEWQRIVEEGFVDFSLGDLGAHLDGCAGCQTAVESLMGAERTWLVIAAELRRELPPASPVCERTLEDFKNRNGTWPVASDGSMSQGQTDSDPPAKSVFCPHCLELVQMEEAIGAFPMRCPACGRAVDAAIPAEVTPTEYDVNAQEENQPGSKGIQEYVDALEARARIDLDRQPYHRGGVPVNLIAGVIFMGCGFWLLATAFMGSGGLMSTLINIILPAFMLMLIGALCLIFWAK